MGLSKKEKKLINGSGLFFFKTDVDEITQLEIVKWYKNLSENDRYYVDTLINEAKSEADFFSIREELS